MWEVSWWIFVVGNAKGFYILSIITGNQSSIDFKIIPDRNLILTIRRGSESINKFIFQGIFKLRYDKELLEIEDLNALYKEGKVQQAGLSKINHF